MIDLESARRTLSYDLETGQVRWKTRTGQRSKIGALAVVLHSYTKEHALYTPAGRKVVVCPATYRDDMNCANCEICYDSSAGRAIIGFPAHGTRKRVIDARMSR